MSARTEADSLSIYFFTGNFSEAYRRFREGEEQDYATHDEIGKLITDIIDSGAKLRIHSFMSAERKCESFSPQLEFLSLGAQRYDDTRVLREAVAKDLGFDGVTANSLEAVGLPVRKGVRVAVGVGDTAQPPRIVSATDDGFEALLRTPWSRDEFEQYAVERGFL